MNTFLLTDDVSELTVGPTFNDQWPVKAYSVFRNVVSKFDSHILRKPEKKLKREALPLRTWFHPAFVNTLK